MRIFVFVGIGVAAVVEVVGWNLPATVHVLASDPSVGTGPAATVAAAFLVALLALGACLANWFVWIGARPAPRLPQ